MTIKVGDKVKRLPYTYLIANKFWCNKCNRLGLEVDGVYTVSFINQTLMRLAEFGTIGFDGDSFMLACAGPVDLDKFL